LTGGIMNLEILLTKKSAGDLHKEVGNRHK
jgi:hypothetical protein